MLPSLIPENLTDVLFFEGACEGIHDAIYENDQALHLSTIEVEIDELNVSVPLTSFNSSEIAKIGIELRSMAKEAFRSILSDSI